jgi:methionyl aminopeptidase
MEGLEEYRKAGKIGSEVREWSKKLVKPGAKALDIANAIEGKIREKGAEISFPCNVSLNEVAAHYTPSAKDDLEIGEDDLVTIDLGAHVDGYISDTAYTIDLSGENQDLVEASEAALEAAISTVKAGVSVSDIGAAVEKEIKSRGFSPIENLTGHQLEKMELHAGIAIPNIKVPYDKVLEEGMAFAIEPFATTGRGRVVEGNRTEIYSFLRRAPTRLREGKKVMEIAEERQGLPFAERWFSDLNQFKLKMALRELTKRDALHGYAVLHEAENGLVSQTEHTLIVESDGCEVTTR